MENLYNIIRRVHAMLYIHVIIDQVIILGI